jgi:hypothetical protein
MRRNLVDIIKGDLAPLVIIGTAIFFGFICVLIIIVQIIGKIILLPTMLFCAVMALAADTIHQLFPQSGISG